ncbi:MAG TPA: DEAD/DEAH box helicase [Burkholderiales bacterium]|nr:DEAD/DEAH box helicase [Burkholderiales bacterium]
MLDPECERLFEVNKAEGNPRPIELYTHQLEALAKAKADKSFVVTTGTGSGKSLSFFLPIIDRILARRGQTRQLIAEEAVAIGVRGRARPQWLTEDEAAPLLDARPRANLDVAAAAARAAASARLPRCLAGRARALGD